MICINYSVIWINYSIVWTNYSIIWIDYSIILPYEGLYLRKENLVVTHHIFRLDQLRYNLIWSTTPYSDLTNWYDVIHELIPTLTLSTNAYSDSLNSSIRPLHYSSRLWFNQVIILIQSTTLWFSSVIESNVNSIKLQFNRLVDQSEA
jgi:hypothetical protein